jgi:dihydroorotase
VFDLAGRTHAPIFVHTRSIGMDEPGSSIESVQEVLADAAATGSTLHIMHVASSGLRQTPTILGMIDGARRHGVDVTTEAYPYTAASTSLASAFFDPGWEKRLGISYGDLQWAATGERLTKASFEKYRKVPGNVIVHMIPDDVVEGAIASPLVMIASDGMPFRTGGEHPRGAGTFSRVLGLYVRERGTIGLQDAIRKMSLMPADLLAGYVPAMRRKGGSRSAPTPTSPCSTPPTSPTARPREPDAALRGHPPRARRRHARRARRHAGRRRAPGPRGTGGAAGAERVSDEGGRVAGARLLLGFAGAPLAFAAVWLAPFDVPRPRIASPRCSPPSSSSG